MKKTTTQLKLSTVTVRVLGEAEMKLVRGGLDAVRPTYHPTGCYAYGAVGGEKL